MKSYAFRALVPRRSFEPRPCGPISVWVASHPRSTSSLS